MEVAIIILVLLSICLSIFSSMLVVAEKLNAIKIQKQMFENLQYMKPKQFGDVEELKKELDNAINKNKKGDE